MQGTHRHALQDNTQQRKPCAHGKPRALQESRTKSWERAERPPFLEPKPQLFPNPCGSQSAVLSTVPEAVGIGIKDSQEFDKRDELELCSHFGGLGKDDFHSVLATKNKQKNNRLCNIRVLDANELRGGMDWFRVSFEDSTEIVELRGYDIVAFCSAMVEYDDTWSFDVKMDSSGLMVRLQSTDIVQHLDSILKWPGQCLTAWRAPPRRQWQMDWDFVEGEDEAQVDEYGNVRLPDLVL